MSSDSNASRELSLFGPNVAALDGITVPRVRRHTAVVALGEIHGVGHHTASALYDSPHFDSIFTASRDELLWIVSTAGVDHPEQLVDRLWHGREEALLRAGETLRELDERQVALVLDRDPQYPAALRGLPDPPRWLFVRGNVSLLSSQRLITVVGTRSPSPYGRKLARRVAELLVSNGFALVSGLAEGIDAEVHERTIALGGQTVAVLGTGLSSSFPESTKHLRGSILEYGGAILTEYFDKEQAARVRFVQRNRIQAGLSEITVPVEAAVPSGTLHTIRFAQRYGRLVLGVKLEGIHDSPLHRMLREEGFPVIDVPETDDVLPNVVSSHYNVSVFREIGERERRTHEVAMIIQYARKRIRQLGLGPAEAREIADGIREAPFEVDRFHESA